MFNMDVRIVAVLGLLTMGGGCRDETRQNVGAHSSDPIAQHQPDVSDNAEDQDFQRVNAGVWKVNPSLRANPGVRERVEEVEVSAFVISRTEVTVAEFREFVEATNYVSDCESGAMKCTWVTVARVFPSSMDVQTWRNPGYEQSEQHPVVALSRNDMERFCQWKSSNSNLRFRLPTVAEWKVAFEKPETLAELKASPKEFCNLRDLALFAIDKKPTTNINGKVITPKFDDGCTFAVPVKMKLQIAGCYFPFGNVSELCTFPPSKFPDLASTSVTFCGGSWLDPIEDIQSTMPAQNSLVLATVGFRLVREAKERSEH